MVIIGFKTLMNMGDMMGLVLVLVGIMVVRLLGGGKDEKGYNKNCRLGR